MRVKWQPWVEKSYAWTWEDAVGRTPSDYWLREGDLNFQSPSLLTGEKTLADSNIIASCDEFDEAALAAAGNAHDSYEGFGGHPIEVSILYHVQHKYYE